MLAYSVSSGLLLPVKSIKLLEVLILAITFHHLTGAACFNLILISLVSISFFLLKAVLLLKL